MRYLTREGDVYCWWIGSQPPSPRRDGGFEGHLNARHLSIASADDPDRVTLDEGECVEVPMRGLPRNTLCTIELPVDYTGCTSGADQAKARIAARHKALKQIATHPALLEALEDLTERADRARSILHKGPHSQWLMLETSKAKAAIAKATP